MLEQEKRNQIQQQIRSPRSAAAAGIVFSILMIVTMILITTIVTSDPADINRDWLASRASTASFALGLVPFTGIAFLWFTGVIRDQLGDWEDKFFATIFLGSGLILVGCCLSGRPH